MFSLFVIICAADVAAVGIVAGVRFVVKKQQEAAAKDALMKEFGLKQGPR